jgi:hypothetical protein
MLEQYLSLPRSHDRVALALWAIHTHVYEKYMVTPRLALISPVRGCGKTVTLDVLDRLVARPEKSDNITAAAIYHALDEQPPRTLLLDEADNMEMGTKAVVRAVLNSGYRKGGSIDRVMRGKRHKFRVFAPVALASIGSLTLPLMSRSIVIHIERYNGIEQLRRFDSNDTQHLDIVWSATRDWAHNVKLNPDPAMPAEIRGRNADNWRPLIAIADAFGPAWGAEAREAAIAFCEDHHDEDIGVVLLGDIRTVFNVFNSRGVNRIGSKELADALIELDEEWGAWCGMNNDRAPHRLLSPELVRLLRRFHIHLKTIWPLGRQADSKSRKGYTRDQFEAAWKAYCSPAGDGTKAQPRRAKALIGL